MFRCFPAVLDISQPGSLCGPLPPSLLPLPHHPHPLQYMPPTATVSLVCITTKITIITMTTPLHGGTPWDVQAHGETHALRGTVGQAGTWEGRGEEDEMEEEEKGWDWREVWGREEMRCWERKGVMLFLFVVLSRCLFFLSCYYLQCVCVFCTWRGRCQQRDLHRKNRVFG